MATFTSFSNILPDPANPITDAGDINVSGTPGPGFAAIGFQSITDTQVSRTISGRGIQRDGGSQHWEFTISYNPIFRYQFDPIDSFLLGRNPRKDPFYVILPQHSRPKDATFATYAAVSTIVTSAAYEPGTSFIMVQGPGALPGQAKPGDAFTISDNADFNHQKVYKVSGVETAAYYQAGTVPPNVNQMRMRISPPLQRSTSSGAVINFINPKFRVITKSDVQEYSLNTDNLYSFSIALEEIQP